ncbi:hypothetical protein [Streptomyces buecherae]|uniref:Uncharacterized protein n=1 Tax=Streptomyces buecherae TaxID=2763006 RepID=A0A7H8NBB2_9ACTN|nr:hypothetical protein [Streptomyces buecherae]QKW51692.1 hypothetical protein HUT08_21620 [Streptomyces buecherae]
MSDPTPLPTPAQTDAPPAPPAPTPAAPAPAGTAAPVPAVVDRAAEQRATEAEQVAQRAQAERDELLAALRSVLDPSGAAGEQDPAKLAEQATTERDAALADVRHLRVELAAHQAAHKAGADPVRLLDSRAVEKQLGALDPSNSAFAEQLDAVIAAAVEANPLLRAANTAPAGPTKGGADFTPGNPQTVTPEQFARMTYTQRVELHQADPDLYRQLSAAHE